MDTKWCKNNKIWNICANTKSTGLKFCRVDVLQELHIFDNRYDVTIATYSLTDLYLPKITDFLVLVLCNVHISTHPLNKQQEQITLLEGEKRWFYLLNGEGLEPIMLPWKCHSRNIMKLCAYYNNCTKFQFYTEKVLRDIPFFVMLQYFVSTMWRH